MKIHRWVALAGISVGFLGARASADEDSPPPPPQAPQTPQVPQTPQTPQTPQAPPPVQTQTTINTQPVQAVPMVVVQPQVVVEPQGENSDRGYRHRTGLVAGGLALSLGTYAVTALAGAIKSDTCRSGSVDTSSTGCRTNTWPLYVPLAGPFIQMGYVNGTGAATLRTLLVLDGVVQIGGLAMAVVGALLPGERRRVAAIERLHLAPFGSSTGAGMAAGGTF